MTEQKKRIKWLDVARSIAIVSITFNHAVNKSFNVNANQLAEFKSIPFYVSIIKVILYSFSRIGVPLFLMITGALLLPRDFEEKGSIHKFVKHNWLQLFITTEIWLAIMFWQKQIGTGSVLATQGIGSCLIRFVMTLFFLNPITMGSMWYMPMILCVYLMIPILSIGLKKIDYKFFLIPIIIVAICSFIIPDINGLIASMGYKYTLETTLESANIFSMYILYLLIGYFIGHEKKLEKYKASTLVTGALLSFAVFNLFQFWGYTREYDLVLGKNYKSIVLLIHTIFLFELIRRVNVTEKTYHIAFRLSKIAFGIYFVHKCIMEALALIIGHFNLNIYYIGKFVVLETVSFFGAIIVIYIFGKVKWIRKNMFVIK